MWLNEKVHPQGTNGPQDSVKTTYPYGYTHSRIEATYPVVFPLNQEFRQIL